MEGGNKQSRRYNSPVFTAKKAHRIQNANDLENDVLQNFS